MQLGVTMFLTDQTIGPVELAREVDARGLSSIWVPEHTHIPTSRRTPAPMGEPIGGSIVLRGPSGTVADSADTVDGEADYFAPLITNATCD